MRPPSIAQSLLLQKFRRYTAIAPLPAIEEIPQGACCGLSIVYGYMAMTNKLAQWLAALYAISLWDEKEETLRSPVSFTAVRHNTNTLGDVLKHIIPCVLSNSDRFNAKDIVNLANLDIFNDEPQELEKSQIKTQCIVAGRFNGAQLDYLFAEEHFQQESINLVCAETPFKSGNIQYSWNRHVCFVRYFQGNWHLYNPDAQDAQIFTKKFHFIQGLIQTMGAFHTFAIRIASCNENVSETVAHFLNKYENLLRERPSLLLSNGGLHTLALHAPHVLLAQINETMSNLALLHNKNLCIAISEQLSLKHIRSFSGLQIIGRYAPEALLKLFDWSQAELMLKCALIRSFSIKNNEDISALHVLGKYAQRCLLRIIEWAQTDKALKEMLIGLLLAQDKEGWTGFYTISMHAKACVQKLIEWAKTDNAVEMALAEALIAQNGHYQWTGLQIISRYDAENLLEMINLMEEETAPRDVFKKSFKVALLTQSVDRFTGLHVIAWYAKDCLIKLIELAEKDAEFKQDFVAALGVKDKNNDGVMHVVRRHEMYQGSDVLARLQSLRLAAALPAVSAAGLFAAQAAPADAGDCAKVGLH